MAPLLLHSTVWHKGRQRRSLLELLRATGRFQATDPRDKVFALLGIAKDTEELDLYPDYAKSYKSICTDVAYKLIRQHGLSILSFAARPGSHELPSWAPDWNLNMVHTLGNNDRHFVGMDVCAGKLDNMPNATNHVSKIDTKLDIPCFHVGTIKAIGRDMSTIHEDLKTRVEVMFTQLEDLARNGNTTEMTINNLDDALFSIPIAYRKPRTSEATLENAQSAHLLSNLFQSYQNLRKAKGISWYKSGVSFHDDYLLEVNRRANGRVPILSSQGYLGIGPSNSNPGDHIYIFPGAGVPFILRQLANGNFTLLGEAYIYGIMYGEFLEQKPYIEVERVTLE